MRFSACKNATYSALDLARGAYSTPLNPLAGLTGSLLLRIKGGVTPQKIYHYTTVFHSIRHTAALSSNTAHSRASNRSHEQTR